LAPDLADEALEPLVETCAGRGVSGLALTNTTVARPEGLRGPHRGEAGGLS
jgi:dihydroorotate dehydrogenase